MKKTLTFIIIMTAVTAIAQEHSGNGSRIHFKNISLAIPHKWFYEERPNMPSNYDSIRIRNSDGTIYILIAYQPFDYNHYDFIEWEHNIRFSMLHRAFSFPPFKNAKVKGVGLESKLWGRKGILSKFNLYKNEPLIDKNKTGAVYNYGESFHEKNMALTITAFIIGKEQEALIKIIRSLEVDK